MNSERIEVRKVYAGRAVLFGFLYGLIFGLIVGIVLLILILATIMNDISVFGREFQTSGILSALAVFSAMIFLGAVVGSLGSFISALIYNLVAKLGGKLHFDIASNYSEDRHSNIKQVKQTLGIDTPWFAVSK